MIKKIITSPLIIIIATTIFFAFFSFYKTYEVNAAGCISGYDCMDGTTQSPSAPAIGEATCGYPGTASCNKGASYTCNGDRQTCTPVCIYAFKQDTCYWPDVQGQDPKLGASISQVSSDPSLNVGNFLVYNSNHSMWEFGCCKKSASGEPGDPGDPDPEPVPICGNNIKETGEECDPPSSSCTYGGKSGSCTSACQCCVRCSVSCVPPSITTANDWWLYNDSCSDRSVCPSPQNRSVSCYEVPSPQPVPNFMVHPELLKTTYGFTSTTYSGGGKYVTGSDDRVNDFMPLPQPDGEENKFYMKANYKDTDQKIEAAYVWFSQSGSNPVTPRFINLSGNRNTSFSTKTKQQFGFMVHIKGTSWDPYIPAIVGSGSDTNDVWRKAPMSGGIFAIKGPGGVDMANVHIQNMYISGDGKEVDIEFSLSFKQVNNPSSLLSIYPDGGKYNVFLMANDVFGFTPYDNYDAYPRLQTAIRNIYKTPDQIRYYNQWVNRGWEWNIDLENPVVDSLTVTVSEQKLKFEWILNDTIGINTVVGNLYISQVFDNPVDEFVISSLNPAGIINSPYTPTQLTDMHKIGHMEIDNIFVIRTSQKTGSVMIDPGENRKGEVFFYITAFDNGGNVSAGKNYIGFDLRDWVVTQGGLFYSSDGMDMKPKLLSTDDINSWKGVSLLNEISPEYAHFSTELIGTSLDISIFPEPEKDSGAYFISPYPAKEQMEDYYGTLSTVFLSRVYALTQAGKIVNLGDKSTLTNFLSEGGDKGKIYYVNTTKDLTVTNGFVCDARGIIFVGGNLNIGGDIKNSRGEYDACIFVVGGNVTIAEGSNASASGFGYDEVNAFILANGTITIQKETESKATYDGLYVSGALNAIGVGTSQDAIILDRFLKLGQRWIRPVVAINHHSKYGVLARELFGSQVDIQKTIVGVK